MTVPQTVSLEVVCDDAGDALVVVGSDPHLGDWAPSSGFRLTTNGQVWQGDLPLPTGGAEFKLVLFRGEEAVWEALEGNRRWPSTGLVEGSTLRTKFGEHKLSVEVSAAAIEANARAFRKLEARQGSALQENLDRKGESAYYHAHNRQFEVPEHAKIITGPGLITGGAPVLLEAGNSIDPDAESRIVWLKDYSWSDGTSKVKVYVSVPEGHLPAEGAQDLVSCEYAATQVDLTISCASKPKLKLKIEKLNAEVTIESCTTRVEAHKNRIVLQLAKKRETTWYNLTKK